VEVRQVILIIESQSYFQGRFGVCEKCGVEDTNMRGAGSTPTIQKLG